MQTILVAMTFMAIGSVLTAVVIFATTSYHSTLFWKHESEAWQKTAYQALGSAQHCADVLERVR